MPLKFWIVIYLYYNVHGIYFGVAPARPLIWILL